MNEQPTIQNTTIQELTKKLGGVSSGERELVAKAYDFANRAHDGQLRASGEPYFNHVVATARTLAEFGMSPTVVAAGLLHDTVEDTDVTEEELEKEFGTEIRFLVHGITKLGKLKYKGVERNAENLRKFFVSMAEDLRVIVIKLADRLHNVQTLQHVRPDKQKRIALETLDIYAPLANRLGMGKLRGLLEDASFPFAYPKEHTQVVELLKEKTGVGESYLLEVERKLKKELRAEGIKVYALDRRVKHLYSLFKKMKKYEMDIDKIYDIIALRVIVETVEECYHVLGIIHGNWKPLPGRIKDYIATPKPNGYQSLHTTIFTGTGGVLEVQIRTKAMHHQAEFGIAAHFAYKEKITGEKKQKEFSHQIAWVQELQSAQAEIRETNSFLESLRTDFFKDRVFIYTPKGDIIDLPEDSCPIDFAYAVHSDIGDHVSGAKVNGKFVALSTKLRSGDIVEISTKKEIHPTSKWLTYAKTNMARNKIQKYLREHESFISKYLPFGKY